MTPGLPWQDGAGGRRVPNVMNGYDPPDVRMRGFDHRVTVEQALAWLDGVLRVNASESVALDVAAGRILAEEVASDIDVPGFDRAMMDGFAVVAADTDGATSYNRLTLEVIGQVLPGRMFETPVRCGQAVRIMTGAPIPPGADAVLPAEQVEIEGQRIHVVESVAAGKHIGPRGEDIAAGASLLSRGRRLRPQDVGVLSSIGRACVAAVRRPRVRIVITGDELLPRGTLPVQSRIADANGPMLEALVRRDGGEAINPGITPDTPEAIAEAMENDADLVLVSGGSSVGQEDHAPRLLADRGELAVHGIAMRPSSPAGMGRIGRQVVILLPGNPVSCLCAYEFFGGRAIRVMGGGTSAWPYPSRMLPLRRKLVSAIGRVDYARVAIVDGAVEPIAISGASLLSSTTRADGFVIVEADSEGFAPGTQVEVKLYDH